MAEQSWTYVDVGVDRIQRYLTRTPDLKGLRGASAWLSHHTHRDNLPKWIPDCVPGDVEVNREAGEADGVVPLRLPPDTDPQPVARAVMAELRARLPGVELTAAWSRGPSYIEAYRNRRPGDRITSLPPPSEFPALETCHQCRADPWVHVIDIHERKDVRVCADCAKRYEKSYRQPALRHGWAPVEAERHLLAEMDRLPKHTARTFDALAELGDPESKRNHLATICADGNGMGELFRWVAERGDAPLKERVSWEVSHATRKAWGTATRKVTETGDTDRVAVIPHVAGGDDLLVSIVADRAWSFVRIFLAGFEQCLATVDALAPLVAAVGVPNASAGLVIAHAKFPFPRATELAQDLLREAKNAYQGRHAAVAWLDATREGDHPPPGRRPWLVAELDDADTALRELRAVPASGRAVMERLIDPGRPVVSMARLQNHSRRLPEHAAALRPFLDGGGDEETRVCRVADALSLARWWR
jgi:hypothetical protein